MPFFSESVSSLVTLRIEKVKQEDFVEKLIDTFYKEEKGFKLTARTGSWRDPCHNARRKC
jgi:hypothetical protein